MSVSRSLRPTRGCYSETGQLNTVIVCSPIHFDITVPTNAMQWLYYSDGLGPPDPRLMTKQHERLVEILRDEGVEVEVLDPHPTLPYQHATRDVGVVIGDRIVLSNLKHWTRQPESEVLKLVLADRYGLKKGCCGLWGLSKAGTWSWTASGCGWASARGPTSRGPSFYTKPLGRITR